MINVQIISIYANKKSEFDINKNNITYIRPNLMERNTTKTDKIWGRPFFWKPKILLRQTKEDKNILMDRTCHEL